QKDPRQPPRELRRHSPERHRAVGTGRANDCEVVTVEVMKFLERLDEEVIERKPNWPAPVGVSAEEPSARLGRLIVHAMLAAVYREHVGMVAVMLRDGADAVGR